MSELDTLKINYQSIVLRKSELRPHKLRLSMTISFDPSLNTFNPQKNVLFIKQEEGRKVLKMESRYGILGLNFLWRHLSSLWSNNEYNLDRIAQEVLKADRKTLFEIYTTLSIRVTAQSVPKTPKTMAINRRFLQQISGRGIHLREYRTVLENYCRTIGKLDASDVIMRLECTEGGQPYILIQGAQEHSAGLDNNKVTIGLEELLSFHVDGKPIPDIASLPDPHMRLIRLAVGHATAILTPPQSPPQPATAAQTPQIPH